MISKKWITAFITSVNNFIAKEAKTAMTDNENMKHVSFSIITSKNLAEEETAYISELFYEAARLPQRQMIHSEL